MGLQDFERRLERLVEGVFAKAFRSGLNPVEIGRRLVREMDNGRTVGVRGTIAPNHFTVLVAPGDHQNLASFAHTLVSDLADYAREHAREEAYAFVGPVEVSLEQDGRYGRGEFHVIAELREREGGGPVGSVVTSDGSRVTIGERPIRIGRDGDCDVVLGPKEVSRHHAEIQRDGAGFVVVDLESMNGTRVNGAGVTKHQLTDGDEITVGGVVKLRFEAS
jgi:hypothetical protein